MTRILVAGFVVALVMTLLPGYALAQESTPQDIEYVEGEVEEEMVGGLRLAKGKHGRKMWRTNYWVNSLEGDKAKIFDSYGMPSSRYREETMGRVEETWTYLEQGLEIVFHGDKIVRTKTLFPTRGPNPGY